MKNHNTKSIIVFFLIVITPFMVQSQSEEVLESKVIEILNSNTYRVSLGSKGVGVFKIYDTKPLDNNDSLHNAALHFLNETIKDKSVYLYIKKRDGDTLEGSILFNCVKSDIQTEELPCKQADFLDHILLIKQYVTYIGTNKMLLNLAKKANRSVDKG